MKRRCTNGQRKKNSESSKQSWTRSRCGSDFCLPLRRARLSPCWLRLQAEDDVRAKADAEKKKKLDELRQEEERRHTYEMARREAESRATELADRAHEAVLAGHREGRDVAVSPADAQQLAAAEAEAARLRALESEELRRIHELEIQLREQSEFGHKIGAHGAADRDATNPNVDKAPLVAVNDPAAAPASLDERLAHQNPTLLRLSASAMGAAAGV